MSALDVEAPRIHVTGTWWRVTRADSDPFHWTTEPADGRWQRGSVVRALYLGDSEATVWAEWYRHTSELGVPPAQRLPRAIWRVDVDIDDIADLTVEGILEGEGIARLDPTRRQWPKTQPIGEACWREGARGVLAPSAARTGGRVLAIFRSERGDPGRHRGPAPAPIRRAARAPARTQDVNTRSLRTMRPMRARKLAQLLALLASVALAFVAGTSLVVGATGTDRSDVVLVFDVSNSILLSTDGTNKEFADALDGIADRVKVVTADLAAGNAHISFIVFGRQAVPYPPNCRDLALHENPAAIARFEACLRAVAAQYRAGAKSAFRQAVNTVDTDHVAALTAAASLLPKTATRSAVVFFTDGNNDPPGTARDKENVVAKVTPAYAGRTPLAILPVGLGTGAGAFQTELGAIYTAFLRDMEPCTGRPDFAWPQVVFPSADAAGSAVALALQEVTCSFTVAPTPVPTASPTPPPAVFGAPTGVRVLPGNGFVTVQWVAPTVGAAAITDYLVQCTPTSGGPPIESTEGVSTATETKLSGLTAGASLACSVAATDGITIGPYSEASSPVIVLGIPSTLPQPGVEPLDGAARLSVAAVGGAPVEQYVYVCTNDAGASMQGAGPTSTVVVTGLANGQTFQCVAYAENSVGRSPASPPSASFSPCSGLFDCNPWTRFALAGRRHGRARRRRGAVRAALQAPQPRLDQRAGRRRREPVARLGAGARDPACQGGWDVVCGRPARPGRGAPRALGTREPVHGHGRHAHQPRPPGRSDVRPRRGGRRCIS